MNRRSQRWREPGFPECIAFVRPGIALAKPGVVYMQTPGRSVIRAQASAICTAACSWRVSSKRNPDLPSHPERQDVIAGQAESIRHAFEFQRFADKVTSRYARHCLPSED